MGSTISWHIYCPSASSHQSDTKIPLSALIKRTNNSKSKSLTQANGNVVNQKHNHKFKGKSVWHKILSFLGLGPDDKDWPTVQQKNESKIALTHLQFTELLRAMKEHCDADDRDLLEAIAYSLRIIAPGKKSTKPSAAINRFQLTSQPNEEMRKKIQQQLRS
jgi:hypothetical protein